ncbi:MAG: hypothetical protein ACOYU2_03820 [Nitrospirota bacterium]
MERKPKIKGLIVIIVMLLAVAFPHYAMGDDIVLNGIALTEPEMSEIRGGFQMPNGNFVYFSMDFMQVRFLSHNEPNTQNSSGWVNMLSQRAAITGNGMEFNMQIVQAGGGDNHGNNGTNSSPGPLQIAVNPVNINNGLPVQNTPDVSIANSLMNNSGFVNANITTGNFNASSIANLININVGFFNIGNASQVLPALRSWMLPY